MSNVLKAFQSKNARRPESFFGQVVSFGKAPDGADGVLVDVLGKSGAPTGTQRLVVLDPNVSIDLAPGKERPGIAKFASAGKSQTAPGGILRIEGAVESGSVWQARWVSGAVHKPGTGRVFTAEARVGTLQTSERTGRTYRALDVLNLDGATPVASGAALKEAVSNAIRDSGAGSAMVRLTLGDQTRAVTVGGRGATLDERVESAFSNETVAAVADALDNGASGKEVVEVIPVSRLWFGGDSAQNPRLDRSFVTSNDDGQQFSKGYRPLMITLQNHADGEGVMVTGVAFADGTPFARHGHPSSASAAVAAPSATQPAYDEPDNDDFPDVDLEGLVERRAPGPGMG